MPQTTFKLCSICGRKGHNCRACPFPGAALVRSLKAQLRVKPAKGRKLRGTGDAAKRNKTKSTVQKTRKNHLKKKQYQKQARQSYSNTNVSSSDASKKKQKWTGPGGVGLGDMEASHLSKFRVQSSVVGVLLLLLLLRSSS